MHGAPRRGRDSAGRAQRPGLAPTWAAHWGRGVGVGRGWGAAAPMAQPMARPVMRCDHVHVLCVQMGPWLAVEIPALVAAGRCARDSQTATRTRHPPPASRVALASPLLTCACARQDHTQGRGEGCVRLSTKSALLLRWPAGCASVCVRAYRLGRLCGHLTASLQLVVTGRFLPPHSS